MAEFLAILAIACTALAWLSLREQRRNAARGEQRRRSRAFAQTSAACNYIDELNKTSAFPLVPTVNLKVGDDEFSLLFEHCTQYEVMTPRAARLRVRRRAAGRRRMTAIPIQVNSGDGSADMAHPPSIPCDGGARTTSR
ncbi:hypothetical protein [Pararobbsia alpina]|uniref:Uncharacterized protein n=1 Tax=Pararobbsia alpina TaxID=621374 RepID=A0A6S7B0M8_9BURK|nr:hypothetical protein [Pararobbsia alpina]CAB3781627.1 hypothetical protein LMG28138_01263 [Pararobbsia alpina]